MKKLFIFLSIFGIIYPLNVFSQNDPIIGRLTHSSHYFYIKPYSDNYDDGSYAKIFYDGNNKILNFWNSNSGTNYTGLKIGNLYSFGNVGIGTTSPTASATGKILHLMASGDEFPFIRLERINGITKTNRAWETFISSNGSYYIRDVSTSGVTDPFIIQPGAPSNSFNISSSGNVGIGTTSPSYKLQVLGDIYANGWLRVYGSRGLYFQSYGGGIYMKDATWIRTYNNKSFYHNSGIMRTDGTFQVGPNGNRFLVNTSGNVGIGTTNPGIYKLAVEGVIGAREVVVTTDGWADFVFDDDYKLKSLSEIDSFIKTNKHLPGIPAENEVKENGINLGEMNAKLLQKIEELTLYMIDINKRMNSLEMENSELKEKIEKFGITE